MDFPARFPSQEPFNAHTGFLAKVNSDGPDLIYSTFLGDFERFDVVGVAYSPAGGIVLVGNTPYGVYINRIVETNTTPLLHIDYVFNTASQMSDVIAPAEWITIRGNGFDSTAQAFVDDQQLPVVAWTQYELQVLVPATFQPRDAMSLRVATTSGSSKPIGWLA